MNKTELEKVINEQDLFLPNGQSLKDFIFNEIIPEVLKEILPCNTVCLNQDIDDIKEEKIYNKCLDIIKQKAKDLYNITL